MSLRVPRYLPPTHVAAASVALLALFLLIKHWASRRGRRYPPGPRPLPLIGNILDLPKSRFALTWTKFGEQYGPLTWLTIPGRNFLVINSLEAAKVLLDKRGSNYTNRPRFVMMGELVGFQEITPLNPYDALWRSQRTLLKHALSAEVLRRDYEPILQNTARRYLGCLLKRPEDFTAELRRSMQQNVIDLTYGRSEDNQGRSYVELNSRVMDIANGTMQGYFVDLIPALRYLPSWLPGMNFKRDAVRWREEIADVRRTTFGEVKESVLSGDPTVRSCYVGNNLQELYRKQDGSTNAQQVEEREQAICHSGFSFFMAGTDTTQNTTRAFMFAMMLHPSVQEKIHAELDRIVGSDRPPTLEDQKDMPYLGAAVLEILRWNPSAVDGVPHAPLKDDIYEGYFIPKDTTVIFNTWGISRNTRYYSNPGKFDPERYLKAVPELDPREFVFGFGRRACPGMDLAYQIVWIMAASILWAFKLERERGDLTPLDNDSNRFDIGMLWLSSIAQSRNREAEKAWREAYEIYSRIGNGHGAAHALLGLGNIYRAQSRNPEAENALNDAHQIYSRIGDTLGTGNALRSLALLYSNQNRYDAAAAFYRQAAALYDLADAGDSRARVLLALGQDYHTVCRYSDAEAAASKALAIWTSTADEECQADASLFLAEIFKSQSRHNEEKDALIQAEIALAQIGRDRIRAETLDRIGGIHLAQRTYGEAEECYRLAQAIYSSPDDIRGEATELFKLGVLYCLQNRYDEAEGCFAEARVAYARVVNKEGEARALDGLAAAYALQLKLVSALGWLVWKVGISIRRWAGR